MYKKIDDNMDKCKSLDKETKNQIVLKKSSHSAWKIEVGRGIVDFLNEVSWELT